MNSVARLCIGVASSVVGFGGSAAQPEAAVPAAAGRECARRPIVSAKPADYFGKYRTHSAQRPWSVADRDSYFRFELRPGDRWAYDPDWKERSEVSGETKLRFDVTYDFSYRFRVEAGAPNPDGAERFFILGQFHQTEDLGDEAVGPPFAIELSGERLKLYVRSTPDALTTSNPPTTVLWQDKRGLARGHWYDVNLRVRFDPKGDGYLGAWLDGRRIADYVGPLGYADKIGPYWKQGVYRYANDVAVIAEFTRPRVAIVCLPKD